ncbi:MAG: D-sedoheptulose 7-phosphate isomerase [Rhodocyclaceae bacterium]|jgi:D-sedoheptulose 7-phosphate isomerase|nr:MAG: D-sedoheptulose 7-phosphate isomerase [Rhodocyclaceae bacterium]TND05580.1 MAG: D-sedoheptulose 7-phosphate isomerase [Rhodocyclaceae bacterium]
MNNIDRFFSPDPAAFADAYIHYLQSVLKGIEVKEIARFIETLLDARGRGATVFFVGNGGSAATASHFANDLAFGTNDYEKPFRVISLTDNVPVLTALGNDFGYEEIFVRQLRVLGRPGDVLVGISASGNSPNLTRAFDYANSAGIKTVAITAFDGGKMRTMASEGIHVPTGPKEYGPAEDAHMVLDHLVGAYLMRYVKAGGKP